MVFDRKYKILIIVDQEKVAAAEEIFQKHQGRAYIKRRTTASSPEFLMNVIRRNMPRGQYHKTVAIPIEETEKEITLCYIVNNEQMESLKE